MTYRAVRAIEEEPVARLARSQEIGSHPREVKPMEIFGGVAQAIQRHLNPFAPDFAITRHLNAV